MHGRGNAATDGEAARAPGECQQGEGQIWPSHRSAEGPSALASGAVGSWSRRRLESFGTIASNGARELRRRLAPHSLQALPDRRRGQRRHSHRCCRWRISQRAQRGHVRGIGGAEVSLRRTFRGFGHANRRLILQPGDRPGRVALHLPRKLRASRGRGGCPVCLGRPLGARHPDTSGPFLRGGALSHQVPHGLGRMGQGCS
mmetsp:Transcript_10387/g.23350  ORF Transcript_10387/g.23350 Transcript_10387/m.23350 type:complete len:201 (-) Transcript_10387:249-851(-)